MFNVYFTDFTDFTDRQLFGALPHLNSKSTTHPLLLGIIMRSSLLAYQVYTSIVEPTHAAFLSNIPLFNTSLRNSIFFPGSVDLSLVHMVFFIPSQDFLSAKTSQMNKSIKKNIN